jgi:hypothetical protein
MSRSTNPTDLNSATLRELSDDVSRIASTLARLAMSPDATATVNEDRPANDQSRLNPPVETVRDLIHARHLRFRFFDRALFADPVWDMLLDLFHAEIIRHRESVESLCAAASVPEPIALRWIKIMSDAGLLGHYSDPHDPGQAYVELSPMASQAMRNFFREMGKPLPESTDGPDPG